MAATATSDELLARIADIESENVRLLGELQERTREVTEALDQQTAMAEVLAIIANSATDAAPVLEAIIKRLAALVGADQAVIYEVNGGEVVTVATLNPLLAGAIGDRYPWTVGALMAGPSSNERPFTSGVIERRSQGSSRSREGPWIMWVGPGGLSWLFRWREEAK